MRPMIAGSPVPGLFLSNTEWQYHRCSKVLVRLVEGATRGSSQGTELTKHSQQAKVEQTVNRQS
jgi:hypothetical protein